MPKRKIWHDVRHLRKKGGKRLAEEVQKTSEKKKDMMSIQEVVQKSTELTNLYQQLVLAYLRSTSEDVATEIRQVENYLSILNTVRTALEGKEKVAAK